MTVVVCDASLIATLLLSDEWTTAVPHIAATLEAAETCAPAHFALEIGSLLLAAERRGRIDRNERLTLLNDARLAVGEIDPASLVPSSAITDLAAGAGLSVYDAAYLDLALRRAATVATNDRKLIAAAAQRGLPIITSLA